MFLDIAATAYGNAFLKGLVDPVLPRELLPEGMQQLYVDHYQVVAYTFADWLELLKRRGLVRLSLLDLYPERAASWFRVHELGRASTRLWRLWHSYSGSDRPSWKLLCYGEDMLPDAAVAKPDPSEAADLLSQILSEAAVFGRDNGIVGWPQVFDEARDLLGSPRPESGNAQGYILPDAPVPLAMRQLVLGGCRAWCFGGPEYAMRTFQSATNDARFREINVRLDLAIRRAFEAGLNSVDL